MSGYVGEISLFADNQLRENHVWADGGTIKLHYLPHELVGLYFEEVTT